MVVTEVVGHLRAARLTVARAWLALALSFVVVVATTTTTALAAADLNQVTAGRPVSRPTNLPRALICRPEPPDYPGCSPAQVRPLLRARFATEYTGHAYGYRYYRMGQHPRGVIFAHLTAALNAKLARLYREAVQRFTAAHTSVIVDGAGVKHVVVEHPRYATWAAFSALTTSFCTGGNVTIHFPTEYCWAITKLGQAGAVINALLNRTTKILLSCDGYAIGGWATGSYAAWRMGTGLLAGGYYGAVGVEIGCQTTNLWNWASHLW